LLHRHPVLLADVHHHDQRPVFQRLPGRNSERILGHQVHGNLFIYYLPPCILICGTPAGLPDFSWSKHTKMGKNITNDHKLYQTAINFTKWPQNIPNGHKIYQHLPFKGPPKFTQSRDFCFENKPSGNPGLRISKQPNPSML
jgi:hypothetical protein